MAAEGPAATPRASADVAPPVSPDTATAESPVTRRLRIVVPVSMLLLVLAIWQLYTMLAHVPPYILPSPSRIALSLGTDWPILLPALLVTLKITLTALVLALVGGAALAIVLVQSKWFELAFYPYAVILQVTPIVAIAPLHPDLHADHPDRSCSSALAGRILPVLSNTTQGLKSTDHNLLNLFDAVPRQPAGRACGSCAFGRAAVFPRRAEDRRRLVADCRGRRRVCRRVVRRRFGPRLPPARSTVPAQHPAPVRGARPPIRNRRRHLRITSLISWLLLRKWHESAVRREN